MKGRIGVIFIGFILLIATVSCHRKAKDQELRLWYSQTASVWEEALPLGNGKTGAMVFGHPQAERIQLNNNTLWSGYPEPGNNPDAQKYLPLLRKAVEREEYDLANEYWKKMQGPYSARYLHMANLHLLFPVHHGSIVNYKRDLDLRTAIASVTYEAAGVTHHREMFISHPDKVLAIRLTANKEKSIHFTAGLDSKLKYETIVTGDHQLVLRGKAPVYVAHRDSEPQQVVYDDVKGEGMDVEVRVRIQAEGGKTGSTDSTLTVSDADAVTIYLSSATSFSGFDQSPGLSGKDPAEEATTNLRHAYAKTYDQLKAAHIADYQKLFGRVQLDLGVETQALKLPTDERMLRFNRGERDNHLQTLYYQFGRYLLISCSRPGAPPANLQGMWNDHVQPPWGSNYTTNINTEMNYWLAETTNLSECHEPLLNFIKNLSINGAQTAKTNYGIDEGWCVHHNSDIWAKTSPPGGYEWDSRSQPRWACWPMAGAWFSCHLWEHYLFTGDEGFLKEDGYPLMKGAAQFLLQWLIDGPDGFLVTNPSTSPENVFKINGKEHQISIATTMDMAITRELFTACILASKALEVDEVFRSDLESALKRLYPYHIGQYGQLQEWFKDWDDPEDKHRHLSHLFGLHPGGHISPKLTPELAAAAKQSLLHRGDVSTGWSMAWKINWWARLGDGNHAWKILKDGLTYIGPKNSDAKGGGTYPNLFDAHPPFQIDGNLGGTAGITEMLMQSHLGEISLLPALPDEWPSGSVRGIRARGGFEIAIHWKDSRLTSATVTSTLGGNCRIRSTIPVKVVEVPFGEISGRNKNPLMPEPLMPVYKKNPTAQLPGLTVKEGYVIEFETERGKSYTVVPVL